MNYAKIIVIIAALLVSSNQLYALTVLNKTNSTIKVILKPRKGKAFRVTVPCTELVKNKESNGLTYGHVLTNQLLATGTYKVKVKIKDQYAHRFTVIDREFMGSSKITINETVKALCVDLVYGKWVVKVSKES
jgi:hypothetical protein